MAGDWIKWTKGLARKREVLAMASILKVDRLTVAAACMELWEWLDDNTEDGHVAGVTIVTLKSLESLPGLVTAMARPEIGWLIISEDGQSVTVPNFSRHNGKSAKKRLLDAERQRASRAKRDITRDKCHAVHVTKSVTREEKRREDSITPLTPQEGGAEGNWTGVLSQIERDIQPPPRPQRGRPHRPDIPTECVPIPPNIDTPELREAWYDWHEYQRQRGTPITQAGAREQMRLMTQWGAERAVKAIRYSMAMGYAGMIEPKTGEGKAEQPKPAGETPDAHLPVNVRAMLRRKAELEAQGKTEDEIREELEKMR